MPEVPEMPWYCYLVPSIPLLTRGLLGLRFRALQSVDLSEDELDRTDHRTSLGLLTGFSFSALLGFLVLYSGPAAAVGADVIYYLLVSFLSFFFALSMQDYKSTRRTDQLATAIAEMGKLALIFALAAQLANMESLVFGKFATIAALVIWLIDHSIRISLQRDHLEHLSKK